MAISSSVMNRIYTLKLTIGNSNGCFEEPPRQVKLEVTYAQIQNMLKMYGDIKSVNGEIVMRLSKSLVKYIEENEE